MNRQQRRAAERAAQKATKRPTGVPQSMDLMQSLASLGELQKMIEQFGPLLPIIEQFPDKLDAAEQALRQAQVENDELRQRLELQRQVFLRLFAQGMDIPLEQVLSMESAMQKQIESEDDAHKTPRTDEEQA